MPTMRGQSLFSIACILQVEYFIFMTFRCHETFTLASSMLDVDAWIGKMPTMTVSARHRWAVCNDEGILQKKGINKADWRHRYYSILIAVKVIRFIRFHCW